MIKKIESRQNSVVKHFIKLVNDKKYRNSQKLVVCEGEKMLLEAFLSNVEVDTVIFSEEIGIDHLLLDKCKERNINIYCVPTKLIKDISTVETPQGLVFSCKSPKKQLSDLQSPKRIIVLDGLQDPGNLGTIIRSADAFHIDAVIMLEGCVDVLSPKVIRSTMGAIFRVNAISCKFDEFLQFTTEQNLKIFATALAEDSVDITSLDISTGCVIIGNEGRGVSEDVINKSDKKIIIPMTGYAESLNASVAASVIMWEMTRGG